MKKLVGVVVASLAGLVLVAVAVAAANRNYSVHLNGALEVPVRDTNAQGQAIFHLAKDGGSIDYKLIVANIENVTMAHIHAITNPATRTGPPVVWLYPSTAVGPADPGGGRIQGPIASGTIRPANLVGPLAGASLEDLLELLDTGQAYVNVHTNDGEAPADTGPGDFPAGEIRGDF